MAPFEICTFDAHAAFHYGDIRAHLDRIGKPIGAMDLLIAAHARSLSLTLVTNDIREFAGVLGLRTQNWVRNSVNHGRFADNLMDCKPAREF